jgi:GT2 family glycosyltransferase
MDLSIIIRLTDSYLDAGAAIESIAHLDTLSYEVLLIDDSVAGMAQQDFSALTNGPVKWLRSSSPTPSRPGLARNEAVFYEASGRYLFFLEPDDKVRAHVLERLVHELDHGPERGVGIAAIEPWDLWPTSDSARERLHFLTARETLKNTHSRVTLLSRLLFFPPIVAAGACIIRRCLFVEIGGFDPDLPMYEDVDLMIRAIRRHGFVYVDEVLTQSRRPCSATKSPSKPTPQLINTCYRALYRTYKKLYGRREYYGLRLLASTLDR